MGDYSFGDFDFSGGEMSTPAFDFSGGEFNPSMDWTAGMSPGNQDWLNSLGTGAGTFGEGMDYNPVEGGEPSWMSALRGGATPQAAAAAGQQAAPDAGGANWMQAGASGLGALGNILGLGVSGLGMANAVKAMQQGGQQQKQFKQAQQNIQQAQQAAQEQQQYTRGVAAPAVQAGASLTRAGEAAMLGGPLPGQMEQMVQKWKNESRARVQQYLAKSGISDSTMAAQFDSWIDQNEGMYRQQLAQSLLTQGYGGITTATPAVGQTGQMIGESGRMGVQAGTMAANQMGGTDQFLREANNSIALLTGAQRGPQR